MISRRELIGGASAWLLAATDPAPIRFDFPGQAPDTQLADILKSSPFERVETSGADALSEWLRLRAREDGWPIVIGRDEDLVHVLGDDRRPVAEILAAAAKMTHPESLHRYRAEQKAAYAALLADEEFEEDEEEELPPPLGEWPSSPPPMPDLDVAKDVLTQKPYERVHILLIPTRHGWEVPAYLDWGGWNECPTAEVHVAALRKWHQVFGAEPAGMNGEVMNVRVASPPTSRDAALALAREQYLYCADIVDQGVNDLSTLAASLMGSGWWYFWWD